MSEPLEIVLPDGSSVSGLLDRPAGAGCLLVLAHGAGADMRHVFMEAMSDRLAERDVATLRFQFPYMEQGGRRPDRAPRLEATVRAAVERARTIAGKLPLFAGGKSMGGRMTSRAAAEGGLQGARGLVFLGFPLHPAGRPGTDRAEHLHGVDLPMLFLQGTRDKLAEVELIEPVCEGLGDGARLHWVEGADHSFHVLKRSGRSDAEVLDELANEVASFVSAVEP